MSVDQETPMAANIFQFSQYVLGVVDITVCESGSGSDCRVADALA
jgi:hypothetical protein